MDTVKNVKELDIYDFDKTMLPFDCGSRFCIYCAKHYLNNFDYVPKVAVAGIKFLFNRNLTGFKNIAFSFINKIPLQEAVNGFWDENEKYIYDWVKKENRERYSVIISASPDFLIKEIARRIEVDDYISTTHDDNGKIIGKNCHDKEKVRLFKNRYPDAKVINVYSDSIKNDKYIFSLAENCFYVKDNVANRFNFADVYK